MKSPSPLPQPPPAFLYLISGAAALAALWAWWYFNPGYNPADGPVEGELSAPAMLTLVQVLSGLVVVVIFGVWLKHRAIATNGAVVRATLSSFGVRESMFQIVVLDYSFQGQRYRVKASLSVADVDGKSEGDTLEIVIDRGNPENFFVRIQRRPS